MNSAEERVIAAAIRWFARTVPNYRPGDLVPDWANAQLTQDWQATHDLVAAVANLIVGRPEAGSPPFPPPELSHSR